MPGMEDLERAEVAESVDNGVFRKFGGGVNKVQRLFDIFMEDCG